jgi:hypothetical protein
MDLMSYQHHSALLYAVPPSSLICLDLLVSLHSWAGTLLPNTTERRLSSPDNTPRPEGLDTPVRLLSRPYQPASTLKATLGESLAQMATMRADLLHSWGLRNAQQHILESEVQRRQAEMDGSWNMEPSPTPSGWTGPVSSSGIESKKSKKMHKIHRSVGGKLRDLLSSSNSSASLALGAGDRGSRTSFDYGQPITKGIPRPRTESVPEHSIIESNPLPRPPLATRHSIQIDDMGERTEIFAGVGGFSGVGDEDDVRGQVGRKNEGVLWTPGIWEGLGKSNPKAKWESESFYQCMLMIVAWVVLDHSKIYEYGGIDTTQFECQAAIDLRFASVREGRDTERRFGGSSTLVRADGSV